MDGYFEIQLSIQLTKQKYIYSSYRRIHTKNENPISSGPYPIFQINILYFPYISRCLWADRQRQRY